MRYGLDDHDHPASPVKREKMMELAGISLHCSRSLRLQSRVVHVKEYPLAPNNPVMLPGSWSLKSETLDIDCNFRTDNALSYHSITPVQAAVSVRGVLEVVVHGQTDLEWFSKKYGIENPQYDVIYSMDVDVMVVKSQYNAFDDAACYRFDKDGNPVKISMLAYPHEKYQ